MKKYMFKKVDTKIVLVESHKGLMRIKNLV